MDPLRSIAISDLVLNNFDSIRNNLRISLQKVRSRLNQISNLILVDAASLDCSGIHVQGIAGGSNQVGQIGAIRISENKLIERSYRQNKLYSKRLP